MKSLFTIHSGEYLVASYIEAHFRKTSVWIPSRDTGIDLLISDSTNRRATSLQVKFSKDFLVTSMGALFQKDLRACGWWVIDRDGLRKSPANLWVFVLLGFGARTTDFVIIPPKELWRRLRSIHGSQKRIQSYIWITERGSCWEARGLRAEDQGRVANGQYQNRTRDFTQFLNNWGPIARLND